MSDLPRWYALEAEQLKAEIERLQGLVAKGLAVVHDLLALAHQYASECGECAGTRVCPDDAPCTECGFIWDVINKAEGKS